MENNNQNNAGMEMFYYPKESKREVPLSQYKILRCHVRYTDKSRIDSVKPGTLVGFTDSEGNFMPISKSGKNIEDSKKPQIEKDVLSL